MNDIGPTAIRRRLMRVLIIAMASVTAWSTAATADDSCAKDFAIGIMLAAISERCPHFSLTIAGRAAQARRGINLWERFGADLKLLTACTKQGKDLFNSWIMAQTKGRLDTHSSSPADCDLVAQSLKDIATTTWKETWVESQKSVAAASMASGEPACSTDASPDTLFMLNMFDSFEGECRHFYQLTPSGSKMRYGLAYFSVEAHSPDGCLIQRRQRLNYWLANKALKDIGIKQQASSTCDVIARNLNDIATAVGSAVAVENW